MKSCSIQLFGFHKSHNKDTFFSTTHQIPSTKPQDFYTQSTKAINLNT